MPWRAPDSVWGISHPEESQETTTNHRESRMGSANNPGIKPLHVCSARQATYHGPLVLKAPMQRDSDIAKRVLRGTMFVVWFVLPSENDTIQNDALPKAVM